MKVGDLVYLNYEQYYEHNEYVGIIIKIEKFIKKSKLFHVMWSHGEVCGYIESDLEIIK